MVSTRIFQGKSLELTGKHRAKGDQMSEIVATYEDQSDDLEQLLSEIEGGYRVTLARKDPPWAQGQLGTVEFSKTDTISVDWLRSRYGGGLFTLKIKHPDGKYITHRTIQINERPKNRNGIEIYPGTDGVPVTKDEISKQPEQPKNDMLITTMREIMNAQAAQSKATQELLLARVSSLEDSLTKKNNSPQIPANYDPNQQLKSTLETMKMIEELKENVQSTDGAEELENPFMSKIIEKLIDKFDDKPASQAQQGSPPLPDRTEPTNMELVNLVKTRLRGMDPAEKEFMVSQVLQDYEEEDEIEDPPRQENNLDVDSLLSGEDQEQLDEANGSESHNAQDDSPAD